MRGSPGGRIRPEPIAAGLLACAAFAMAGRAESRPRAADPPPAKTAVAPAGPAATPSAASAAGAARVTVEVIVVDRRGTWSAGIDEADIISGGSGVLKRSATLVGRAGPDPPREMIELGLRVHPALQQGGSCALRLEAETRAVVAGAPPAARPAEPARRSAALVLGPDEDRLVEIYASPVTQGRLALRVRCGAAFARRSGPGPAAELELVDFELAAARADDGGPMTLLKSNRLRAGLGREATNHFAFNLPLPEGRRGAKRYRRERLEIELSPILISGGRLQAELRVRGEIATVSAAEEAIAHPVDHRETLVLASGEAHLVRLDVPSSGEAEGWGRVGYELQIVARFNP
jgi:hypothetical protein